MLSASGPTHAAILLLRALRQSQIVRFSALGGKGSGNYGHAGRKGEVGGSAEGRGGGAQLHKVRNERSLRALKHFVPIHAQSQRYAERNELAVRKMVGGIRTDDNLPVDVITKIDGRTHGIEAVS